MPSAVASAPTDRAIRSLPVAWFRPDPRVYWADLLVSATVGWALWAAVAWWGSGRWPLLILALLIAILALYRAVHFIHEITHLAPRDVPAFRVTWNALVGVPLLLPSFLVTVKMSALDLR